MRILVTGAEGILGKAIREWLASGNTLYLWGRDEVDVRDRERVLEAAKGIEFDAVIHAAAMTAVDRCETEFDLAMATNRDGTKHVASLAAERGATMVYLSTDYVFDGTKDGPYLEDDPPKPISAYGRTKLAGEEVTRKTTAKHLTVRTSWDRPFRCGRPPPTRSSAPRPGPGIRSSPGIGSARSRGNRFQRGKTRSTTIWGGARRG